jgi:hypothetical protein
MSVLLKIRYRIADDSISGSAFTMAREFYVGFKLWTPCIFSSFATNRRFIGKIIVSGYEGRAREQ